MMKKVNLFNKKLMSLGLVASLFVTSLGVKPCFAEGDNNTSATVNATLNVNLNGSRHSSKQQAYVNKQHNAHANDKKAKFDEVKEILKKAWTVCEWTAVCSFLVYAGYKNGRDIINLGRECKDFILENKEIFEEVLDGGIAVINGMRHTISGAVQLIYMLVKFVCEHTESTKNILALVGTYNIYNCLKNKVKSFCSSRKNKNTEFNIRAIATRK